MHQRGFIVYPISIFTLLYNFAIQFRSWIRECLFFNNKFLIIVNLNRTLRTIMHLPIGILFPHLYKPSCLQSYLQISPPTPQSAYAKFWNPRTTWGERENAINSGHFVLAATAKGSAKRTHFAQTNVEGWTQVMGFVWNISWL